MQKHRFTILSAFLLLGTMFASLTGCAWKIIPPAEVASPVAVQITEYGRHTRLALPAESGREFIEYGFGEWHFYGLEKRGSLDALRSIFGLGEGAFSRRILIANPGGDFEITEAGGGRSESILVESHKVTKLRDRLEARWKANAGDVRIRAWDSVPVSRDPAPYHLFNNSNLATARWLEELGCKIHGIPVDAKFTLKNPAP